MTVLIGCDVTITILLSALDFKDLKAIFHFHMATVGQGSSSESFSKQLNCCCQTWLTRQTPRHLVTPGNPLEQQQREGSLKV
jgi:hypothetical protein